MSCCYKIYRASHKLHDRLAGRVPEAPRWMQDVGLEWLYRLIQEPGRLFKRYAVTNTKFIWYQLTNAKRKGI